MPPKDFRDACIKKYGQVVMDRHVLLVDDVLSTGATVDQCGRTLLEIGARTVTVAVAAT